MNLFGNFFEQETVRVGQRYGTLLDLQAGKALVLLFEDFREPDTNGLVEVNPISVHKQYSEY